MGDKVWGLGFFLPASSRGPRDWESLEGVESLEGLRQKVSGHEGSYPEVVALAEEYGGWLRVRSFNPENGLVFNVYEFPSYDDREEFAREVKEMGLGWGMSPLGYRISPLRY